jgi:hypothetical protein
MRKIDFVSSSTGAETPIEPALKRKRFQAGSKDVVLIVGAEEPDLIPDDVYLKAAIEKAGLTPRIVSISLFVSKHHSPPCQQVMWDDETVDWSSVRVAILRSLWEYVDQYDAFLAFVDK